jgi:ribonuclease R
VLASDTGKPNKKAASKKSRPSSKAPKKSAGINVNAAKAAGKHGAKQSKSSKASRGKSASIRTPGKPAGSKPPVRKGKR